jgi:hypothetical protein
VRRRRSKEPFTIRIGSGQASQRDATGSLWQRRVHTRIHTRRPPAVIRTCTPIQRNHTQQFLTFFFFSCPCGSSRICKAAPSLASDSLTLLACLLLLLSSCRCSRVALGGGGGRQTPLDAWQGLGARQESLVVVSTQ